MSLMPLALRRWIDTRIYQLRGPQPGPIVLGHRRVYVLPTVHGCVFGLVLLLMLAGSINYSLSLGFVLTFLLAGLGVNGIFYTFRNLANLRISGARPAPVFAGEMARFPLRIENPSGIERAALQVVSAAGRTHDFDVAPQSEEIVPVELPAARRGRLAIGRVMLQTRFPLGLVRAWTCVEPQLDCVVYPRPETPPTPLPAPEGGRGDGSLTALGNEDFAGLRAYLPGDSPRRIAWKADARDRGLLSKIFSGQADARLWLEWEALPAGLDTEARIARLAAWVLQADAAGLAYGLRLPGVVIEPGSGSAQRNHCLEALALFPDDAPAR